MTSRPFALPLDTSAPSSEPTSRSGERDSQTRVVPSSLEDRCGIVVARTVAGRHVPFVGRDRELGMLLAAFAESRSEPMARAMMVTGPPGSGKTRLCFEALRTIVSLDEPVAIWGAVADPIRQRAALGLVRGLLCNVLDLRETEPREAARARILEHVGARLRDDVERVAAYIGELVGVAFDEAYAPSLSVARREPALMAFELERAFEDLVAAECGAHPLLIVVEDLHAADAPSLRMLGGALASVRAGALFLLATGRPEVHDLHPALWTAQGREDLVLGPLRTSAAASLVQKVLGDLVPEDHAASLAEAAGGSALILEELMRAEIERRGTDAPAARHLVRSRIEGFSTAMQRIAFAASVLGSAILPSGVEMVLGPEADLYDVDAALDALVERDVLVRQKTSRSELEPEPRPRGGARETELRFRHASVRDIASSMLSPEDRAAMHGRAVRWLDQRVNVEPASIAEHASRAGDDVRANAAWIAAAERALAADDARLALDAIGRAHPIEPLDVARVRGIEATAHRMLGHYRAAEEAARDALAKAPRGSRPHLRAAGEAAIVASRLSSRPTLVAVARDLLEVSVGPDDAAHLRWALTHVAMGVRHACSVDLAVSLTARVHEDDSPRPKLDPETRGRLRGIRAIDALHADDLDAHVLEAHAAVQRHIEGGPLRRLARAAVALGCAYLRVGAYRESERVLRTAIGQAERLGLGELAASARAHFGLLLARIGEGDEGRAVVEESIERFRAYRLGGMEGRARLHLATISLDERDHHAAFAEAIRALPLLKSSEETLVPWTLAVMACAELGLGRAEAGRGHAREAMDRLASLGAVDEGEALVRLAHAESLMACEKHSAARAAIAQAHARVLERARKIGDPTMRRAYVETIPEHVRIAERLCDWI